MKLLKILAAISVFILFLSTFPGNTNAVSNNVSNVKKTDFTMKIIKDRINNLNIDKEQKDKLSYNINTKDNKIIFLVNRKIAVIDRLIIRGKKHNVLNKSKISTEENGNKKIIVNNIKFDGVKINKIINQIIESKDIIELKQIERNILKNQI